MTKYFNIWRNNYNSYLALFIYKSQRDAGFNLITYSIFFVWDALLFLYFFLALNHI